MNAKIFKLPPLQEPLRLGENPAKEPAGLAALVEKIVPLIEDGYADKVTALRIHPVQRQAMVIRLREAADLLENTPEQVVGLCLVGLYIQSRRVSLNDGPLTQYLPGVVRIISGAPLVTEFLSNRAKPETPFEEDPCPF